MNIDEALSGGFSKDYPKAFDCLVKTYYGALCVHARKFVDAKDEASGVVHEVFLHLWEKQETFTSVTNVKAYLYMAVQNTCLNYLKKLGRHTSRFQKLENEDAYYTEVIQPEVLLNLNASINSLPAKCRKIFNLLYFERLSVTQVANRLKLSVSTVKAQKSIAIKKLNSKLFGDDVFTIAVSVGTAAAIATLGAILFFLLSQVIK